MYEEGVLKADLFTLSIDIANYEPDSMLAFWVEGLVTNKKSEIHVILFRSISSNLQEKLNLYNIPSTYDIPYTIHNIKEYIMSLQKTSIVIMVGAERLIPYSICDSLSKVEMGNREARLHVQESEDWSSFCVNIDGLYAHALEHLSGLICICNVNENVGLKICQELNSSNNMSIIQAKYKNKDNEKNNSYEILKEIKGKNLEESLKLIDIKFDELGEVNANIVRAVVFFDNGNISEAIKILETQYAQLTNEIKCFLGDLYIISQNRQKAQAIVEDIYVKDNRQKGLYELSMRAYEITEVRYAEIIKDAIKYEPDNPAVIEGYGSWLSEKGNYNEAATMFRKLPGDYYELVARINDLLDKKETNIRIVHSYINDIVERQPDLINEAVFRISSYEIMNGSFYGAYEIMKTADTNIINEKLFSIISNKIYILKDTQKASKALGKIKPNSKPEDAERLAKVRNFLLLESIKIFAYKKDGYHEWRSLLECQPEHIWKKYVLPLYVAKLEEISDLDIEDYMMKSLILNINDDLQQMSFGAIIKLLRMSNSGEIQHEKFGITRMELEDCSMTWVELNGNIAEKMWIRYYLSIGASICHENPQDANNQSLSILEYINSGSEKDKHLCATLFLLSWGNAQYRIGNYIEGISCTLVGLDFAINLKEIVLVLEEGVNILSRYLNDTGDIMNSVQKEKTIKSFKVLSQYSLTAKSAYVFLTDDVDSYIDELIHSIENDEKNGAWLIDFSILVQMLAKNNDFKKASELIKKYYSYVQDLSDMRRDIIPDMFNSWSDIVLRGAITLDNILFASKLLSEGINYAKIRREIFHQEERRGVAEIIDSLIRKYLQLTVPLYLATDIDDIIKKKLYIEILDKLSIILPLSVIEQKRYYNTKILSDELVEKDRQYRNLKDEYTYISQKNNVDNEHIQKLAHEVLQLNSELVEQHPNYKMLKKFEGTNWKEIQEKMNEIDLVYQYVITQMGVISILVTKNVIKINSTYVDAKGSSAIEFLKYFRETMESVNSLSKAPMPIFESVSALIGKVLLDYVQVNKVGKVFIIPDIKYSSFPISTLNMQGKYLIDLVDEVVNFMDYEALINYMEAPKNVKCVVYNKLFGSHQDSSIRFIKNWLKPKEKDNFYIDISEKDSIEKSELMLKANTLILYGHGVSEPAGNQYDGAQTICGIHNMININEVIEGSNVVNLFVISCMGGVPNTENPEKSTGTWMQIFERMSGNVLLCKWSVNTKASITLLENILENIDDTSIANALIKAQRKLKNLGNNEYCWGGIEYWIN